MGEYKVKEIENLLSIDISHLVKESNESGFRFLGRLVKEYEEGINTFDKEGESLYGVYNKKGLLIAIGGLNRDPFSLNEKYGRLRRFYVAKDYQRLGIGTLLLNSIILKAKNHYEVLVLHTDTTVADQFYTALGFNKSWVYPNSTHFLNLLH